MVMITKAGEENGITEKGTSARIENVLKKYSLMTEDSHSLQDIITYMNADKKRTADSINFVLLSKIGESFTQKIKNDDIPKFFGVKQ